MTTFEDDDSSDDDPDDKVVMQPRCPTCDAEQYAMNVLAFSHGEVSCGRCGDVTTVYRRPADYHAAMQAGREARQGTASPGRRGGIWRSR